jgi:hypothetical protein
MEVTFDELAKRASVLEEIREYSYSNKNSKTTIQHTRIALHWYRETRSAKI